MNGAFVGVAAQWLRLQDLFAVSGLYKGMLEDIEVDITVELGATIMPIHHLLRMGRGAVIELDATERDPMRVYANNKLVAKGEIRVDEGNVTIQITEKAGKSE